jgi:hypothetical protein
MPSNLITVKSDSKKIWEEETIGHEGKAASDDNPYSAKGLSPRTWLSIIRRSTRNHLLLIEKFIIPVAVHLAMNIKFLRRNIP